MSSPSANLRAHSPETAIRNAVNATIANAIPLADTPKPPDSQPQDTPSPQPVQESSNDICDVGEICGSPPSQPAIPLLDPRPQTLNPSSRGGPRTPEGKARSRLNALKHGLTARLQVILPGEDPAEYQALADSMSDDFHPRSASEHILVHRLVNLTWSLLRIPAAEARIFRRLNDDQRHAAQEQNELAARNYASAHWSANSRKKDPPPPPLPIADRSPAELLADQFVDADDKSNPFARLHRYESSLQRTFDKTLTQLRQLQASRAQNELQSQNELPTDDGQPATETPPPPPIENRKPKIENPQNEPRAAALTAHCRRPQAPAESPAAAPAHRQRPPT